MKIAYTEIFRRLGFAIKITEASGGVFTTNHTHEFQVIAPTGEDTVYFCSKCEWGVNQEIFDGKEGEACPSCKKGKIRKAKSIEVGNIFPLGTWYAERMRVYYSDSEGKKKPVWFGSYGIGPTRVMGTLVEVSHDDKGIIWYPQVAPFDIHLIELKTENLKLKTEEIYNKLRGAGIEVLWDDREISAGEKFADSDLIGIPVRLVVSEKTRDKIEWKERNSSEVELLTTNQVVAKLQPSS
jgi:prolyl-tRNA synthetase